MLRTPGPTSRRGKLAGIAAPTTSSLNRVRTPAAAGVVGSSSSTASKRAPSAHREAPNSRQERRLSNGHLPFCIPTSNKHSSEVSAAPRLCKLSPSQASSPTSDRPSLSQASFHRSMGSSDGKSTTRTPNSLSDKPNRPASNTRMTANGGKSAEVPLRRRPMAPKKVIKDATPAVTNKRASQTPIEVKQCSKEGSLTRVHLNGQPANKIRREKIGIKGRRRGYHISDLPSRRRALTYRGHPSKREIQLRRNSLDDAASGFPLLNLEEYLKQRGPRLKHATLIAEDMGSPGSFLSSLQKRKLSLSNQSAALMSESAPRLSGIRVNDPRILAKFSVHTYISEHEADDGRSQLNPDKSRYSRSLHQPAAHRSSKSEGLLHYAGSCFNVSTRRVEGRRRHVAYMYNSERSLSSFGSETEMAPLMTEPEPFHDFSDDQSASSVGLDEPQAHYAGGLTCKDIHSQDCEPGLDAYKDIHTLKASYTQQDLALKQPRDITCKHRSISQKYRPKFFKDILGQKMVAESLSNTILRSKVAPVYLFYGPRGTGKTTAARIFTCAMNCLSIEELRPCGLCKECISFNAGTNYDAKELDAAGNNDLESMKAMLKHLCLPPSVSRYKVFIMDDCHMLTSEVWNALLKSLEEPPEYVVFILITTDLDQIPRAALSRCQKFMFNRIKDADIVFRLKKLAQLEKVDSDIDALHFIASQSDGSLRDAEMMLDQLSLLGKKVTLSIVREMVGLIPEDDLISLLEMALSLDTVNTVHTVNSIRELMGSGVEPLALTSQLAMLITDILAGRCQISRYAVMKVTKDQQDKLQHALKVLSELEKQLRSCSDRTTWFTAAFLQLSTSNNFHPSSSRGTSAAQSPAVLAGGSERETQNWDDGGRRYSWGGKEKWDEYERSQGDNPQDHSLCESSSGPSMDTRIYPCDHSPQSGISFEGKKFCKEQGRATGEVYTNSCGTLSPLSINEIWQKVLQGNSSKVLKQLLQGEAKLVSISLAEGFAIACLEFRSPEHKNMAERAKLNISKAFQTALLCPVKVEISLSSSSQGRGNFTDRRTDHSIQIHSEHSENVQGSFRNSVSRREVKASSPTHLELELRKSLQVTDGDTRSNPKKHFGNTSCQDLQICRGTGELMSCVHREATDVGYGSEHQISKEQRSSFDDLRCSASLRWSDTREDMEFSSDSENDGRYAPGLLCWKGTRIKDDRGKHHVLRRRKARFLLRLVPCGKGEGEEDEKMERVTEV